MLLIANIYTNHSLYIHTKADAGLMQIKCLTSNTFIDFDFHWLARPYLWVSNNYDWWGIPLRVTDLQKSESTVTVQVCWFVEYVIKFFFFSLHSIRCNVLELVMHNRTKRVQTLCHGFCTPKVHHIETFPLQKKSNQHTLYSGGNTKTTPQLTCASCDTRSDGLLDRSSFLWHSLEEGKV